MDRDAIIDALIAKIDAGCQPNDLLEPAVRESNPRLYGAGMSTFGTWSRLLAETAMVARILPVPGEQKKPASQLVDEERPERVVGAASKLPLLILTGGEHFGGMTPAERKSTRSWVRGRKSGVMGKLVQSRLAVVVHMMTLPSPNLRFSRKGSLSKRATVSVSSTGVTCQ